MACLFLLLIFGAPAGAAPATPQLAVVIDDIGYSLKLGQTAVDLPATVSLALLPYAPNSLTLARRAAAAGKEIILHQPMQAETRTRVERGTLTRRDG